MEEKDLDIHFFNVITLFAQTGWYQLGKVASPVDGKINRDLKSAQFTIDTLLMIREKTKGNLSKKEGDLLNSAISDLQINYADEAAKEKSQEAQKTQEITEKSDEPKG